MDIVMALEQSATCWLAQDVQRRKLHQAARAAYAVFARRYPEWAAALFDEHFVQRHLLPSLVAAESAGRPLTPAAVAEQWARQVGGTPALRRQQQPSALAMAGAYLALVAQARGAAYQRRATAFPTVEAAG